MREKTVTSSTEHRDEGLLHNRVALLLESWVRQLNKKNLENDFIEEFEVMIHYIVLRLQTPNNSFFVYCTCLPLLNRGCDRYHTYFFLFLYIRIAIFSFFSRYSDIVRLHNPFTKVAT